MIQTHHVGLLGFQIDIHRASVNVYFILWIYSPQTFPEKCPSPETVTGTEHIAQFQQSCQVLETLA